MKPSRTPLLGLTRYGFGGRFRTSFERGSKRARRGVPLAFIWCAVAIAEDTPALSRRLVLFGGGALSALELLVKLDEGLLIAGMFAVAAITMEGRRSRNILSFGLTFLASLLTFWFAAGQGISNLDAFVTGSVQVTRGYSSAMAYQAPRSGRPPR